MNYFSFQIISFEVLILVSYCYGQSSTSDASSDNALNVQSWATLPHETEKLLHRQKRQGGGGIIPFRPLFVYRQQQREMQEKWKEIEERKKLRQQQLQYQQYEQYQESIKPQQPVYRPITQYEQYHENIKPQQPPYRPTTHYSSYNYPSTRYKTYTYPSYYSRDKYPTYQSYPSYYDSEYYDGYEYSYF